MTENRRTAIRSAVSAVAFVLGGGLLSGAALAQEEFALEDWKYEEAYQGWSAEQLMDDAEVYGQTGEEIGTVENLLINEQGKIAAIIAQVGGIWDIGDTHVAVPWEEVSFADGRVMIPVTQENVEDYSEFDEEWFTKVDVGSIETVDDDVQTGSAIWKATDLIDDYAVLENGARYGYVNDLIFAEGGQLQAVIVSAVNEYGPGFHAYPWYGPYGSYAWEPGLDYYVLPYDETEIAQLDTDFDYDRMEGATATAGAPGGEAGEGASGAEVGAGADTQEQGSNAGQDTQSGSQQ